MTDKIILPFDPEAATYRTDIKGWVSRNGMFYGDGDQGESTARWAGATHVNCSLCGVPTPKGYTICDGCRNKKTRAKWEAMPRQEYDGGMLYSLASDRWFRDESEVLDFLENEDEEGIGIDGLLLVMARPVYPSEIEPSDYYSDDLPEDGDGEVAGGLQAAFDDLNAYIREHRVPLSYVPDSVVPVFDEPVSDGAHNE